jgi:hypothetical protein
MRAHGGGLRACAQNAEYRLRRGHFVAPPDRAVERASARGRLRSRLPRDFSDTPERRVLDPLFVVNHAFVASGEGRGLALGRRIKDAVQELIKAHWDAVRVY